MCRDRIARFLEGSREDSFEELALAAFRFQYDSIEPIRGWCERSGRTPRNVSSWREIPAVPALAFKSVALHAATPQIVFRSSGTSAGGVRSEHHHPFLDLYRSAIDHSFPRYCLPHGTRIPMASLVPSCELAPDSSLSFMIDHVLATFAAEPSLQALSRGGPDLPALRSWLAGRQRRGEPCLVLATTLSLHLCLEGLERLDLRFRLPPGSVVFETGGAKTRGDTLDRSRLHARLEERLGISRQRVVQEYGMTELTSQAYTDNLRDGDPDLFLCPPWMRARVVDPESLAELPAGRTGLLAVLDLANLGSAVHVLTEDLGQTTDTGFRLAGRARGAELRGCSLTVEELQHTASS